MAKMLKEILQSASKSKKGLVTLDVRESFLPGPRRSDIRAAASLSPPVKLIDSPQPSKVKSPAGVSNRSMSQHNESSSSYNAPEHSTSRSPANQDARGEIQPSVIPRRESSTAPSKSQSPVNPDTSAVPRRRESSTASNSDPLYAKIDSNYRNKSGDGAVQVEVEVHKDVGQSLRSSHESSESDEYHNDQQQLIDIEESDDNTFVEISVPPVHLPPTDGTSPPPEAQTGSGSGTTMIKSPQPPQGILKVPSTESGSGPKVTTPVKTSQKPLYTSSVTTSGGSSKAEFVFSPRLPPLIYQRLGIDNKRQSSRVWIQVALTYLAFCALAALLAMFILFAVSYSDLADESGGYNAEISVQTFDLKLNLPQLKYTSAMSHPQTETYMATRYQLLQYIGKTLFDLDSYMLNDYYGYTQVNQFRNSTIGVDASLTVVLEDIEEDEETEQKAKYLETMITEVLLKHAKLWTFILPTE